MLNTCETHVNTQKLCSFSTYTYTHIHTRTHIHIHIHIHTYTHTHLLHRLRQHEQVSSTIGALTHTHTHIHIHLTIHVANHVCVRVRSVGVVCA